MEVALALDLGSSSARCTAYTLGGGLEAPQEVPESRAQHEWQLQSGEDGRFDADGTLAAVDEAVDACLASLPEGASVAYVAIASFVMNLVGVDEAGEPLTPLLSYAADAPRVHEESARLKAAVDVKDLHRRTGTYTYHSSYAPAQLAALELDGDAVQTFTSLASLLLARWAAGAGEPPSAKALATVSLSEAAWTGMLNLRSMDWDQDVLDLLPTAIRGKLPAVSRTREAPIKGLSAERVRRWPALEGARFFLGVADGAAANVGSMCVSARRVAVTVGTSAAARVVLPRSALDSPDFPPAGLWCYCLDEQSLLLGGALTDGGSIYAWAKDTLRWDSETEARAAALAPGEHGLTVLPFLRGERALAWRGSARMAVLGIGQDTGPSDILRAALEGVGLRLGLVVERLLGQLSEADLSAVQVQASGASLEKSTLLQHILADFLDRPLYTSAWASEATSRGAVMLAEGLAAAAAVADNVGASDVLASPDQARGDAYRQVELPRHQDMEQRLSPDE